MLVVFKCQNILEIKNRYVWWKEWCDSVHYLEINGLEFCWNYVIRFIVRILIKNNQYQDNNSIIKRTQKERQKLC